jgi:phage major head subunit gpT-like protein
MPNVVFQPEVVRRIEDNIEYIISDSWARRRAAQWWQRLMMTRSAQSKRELVQWLLDTAKIRPIGNGGSQSYDDLVEAQWEFIVERFGAGLQLSVDEIEDGKAFDRAGSWARHMGNSASEWPQQQATDLLKNGKTRTCYDGRSFFHASHWVNAATKVGDTFPNIHYEMPFCPANLAEGFKRVAQIKAPDGKYRKLKAKLVAGGEVERLRIVSALGAEFSADMTRSGTTASATNVIKTSYGFSEPIIDAEFDETADVYVDDATGKFSAVQGAGAGKTLQTSGVWYLACELVEDDTLGGLVFSEGKAFQLNSYSHVDDVVLAQMDDFEWLFKGRNGSSYGHPFLLHRFEPGAAP